MAINPRDVLRATRPGDSRPAGGGDGPVQVMLALRTAGLSDEARGRLAGLGLEVRQAVGNKLVGTVPADRLDALRRDPAVQEVETAVRLGPHRAP